MDLNLEIQEQTAADMARFMIAHLNGGRLGTTRILKAATVEAMQRRRFTNHPAVSGLTYGFQELSIAGQRVLARRVVGREDKAVLVARVIRIGPRRFVQRVVP